MAAGAPTPAGVADKTQILPVDRSGNPLSRPGLCWYFLGMDPIEVRPARPEDAKFIRDLMTEQFSAPEVAVHGELIDATTLPALIAWSGTTPAGLLTYRPDPRPELGWEVVSLGAAAAGRGAGSALIEAVKEVARAAGAKRLWVVTTNNNVHALRFYQRRGFDLVRVHRDAVTRARALKPKIPTHADGIAIRHEIELEMILGDPV